MDRENESRQATNNPNTLHAGLTNTPSTVTVPASPLTRTLKPHSGHALTPLPVSYPKAAQGKPT